MSNILFEDQIIGQGDFPEKPEYGSDFIECTFDKCNLFERDLSNLNFTNSTFSGCELSMSKLQNVQLNNVIFKDCKIMGVDFSKCTGFLFEANFYNCILDFCSFENLKMQGVTFKDTSMKGVDLTGSNLQKSNFLNTDLHDARFSHTNLKEANLSTAFNFIISPTQNNLKKAIFSEHNVKGLLYEFGIHIV
ncbi:pentapeptide repeat-containing protein [Dysgonomonas macrotermitis]|uniref:Uncharacterized protein YjbI, contains pentapeptide repeats n=1 Tax=Dysgonomonas macrotermitis TaxID=1346286 RepID=A0A1M5BBE8_9BACT|nr:pentapeptide repeat-containing protein [Dysgonomonas macrotermitis]SHF39891.1 Uncharacterized protein YjbI, contains pentapeptide repeats [Dysgonomonas macrotermitis]